MAQIFGPGFYANEIDQSFQTITPSVYGSCFIGLTEKGPAFEPIVVEDWKDFQSKFGDLNDGYYLPYAVKGFLKYSGPATIIKVLGKSAPDLNTKWGHVYGIIYNEAASSSLLAEIYSNETIAMTAGGVSENFSLELNSTTTASGLSLDPDSRNFFKNILNTNVSSSYSYYVKGAYCYSFLATQALDVVEYTSPPAGPGHFDEGDLTQYSNGRTPWLISQYYGSTTHQLFKVHTLGDGNYSNTETKISVENIAASQNTESTQYGTFDIVVRKFDDTDNNQIVIESFKNLSLDPNADNYILRQIGDRYYTWNTSTSRFDKYGEYLNRSKYIRIKLDTDIDNVPKTALPMGFKNHQLPYLNDGNVRLSDVLPSMSDEDVGGNVTKYFGINFDLDIGDALKVSLSHSFGSSSTEAATYDSYSIDGFTSTSLSEDSYIKWRKFTVPFYKGWDALDHTATTDYSSLRSELSDGYLDALNIAGDPEQVSVTDIYVPGVSDSTIIDQLIEEIEDRKDVFAVIDSTQRTESISTQIDNAKNYDSSYVATYYPWLQMYDPVNEKYVWVPPSVGVAEAIAFTDKNAEPWYAPAGFRRGILSRVIKLAKNLYNQDVKDLDAIGVNAIKKFPGEIYPVIWGQKTLQKKSSALESVNVRRLIIYIKKRINIIVNELLWEKSNPDTWNEFKSRVNPICEDIRTKRGLKEFKVIMDETLNTPDTIDRNIMKAQLYLQPTRAAEILIIDFTIDKTSSVTEFNG